MCPGQETAELTDNLSVGNVAVNRSFTSQSICIITTSRGEVDQQELISSAKFVGHGADHFSSCRCHGNPDGGVCMITAVHLQ